MTAVPLERRARETLAHAMADAAEGQDFRRLYRTVGGSGELTVAGGVGERSDARRHLEAEVRRAGGGGLWALVTDGRLDGGPVARCEAYDLDRGESVGVVQPYRKEWSRCTGVGPARTTGPAEPLPSSAGTACARCAARMASGTRFCTACGASLAAAPDPERETVPSGPESARGTVEGPESARGTAGPESARETSEGSPPVPPPAPAPSFTPVPHPGRSPVPTTVRPGLPTARGPQWPAPPPPPHPPFGGAGAPWPGTPGPDRSRTSVPTGVLIGGGVALVAAILVIAGLVAARTSSTTSAAPVTVEAPASSAAAEPGGSTDNAASADPTAPGVTTGSDPTGVLGATAQADTGRVEALTGSWVPQLSAKREGLVADGRTYDDASILALHRSLVSRYPGAALLRSGDYSTYMSGDFWVTVDAQPFSTPEAANAWCDAQGFAATECYAKLLSHTAPPTGSTRSRGN